MKNDLVFDEMDIVTEQLINRLKKLFDDEEFLFGILNYADNVEDRLELLNFIDAGNDVSVETVTVLALELSDTREALG